MTAADFLISGGGTLDPDWFNGDATTILTQWINSVTTSNPNAVEACVYARAYTYLADRRALLPTMQRDRDKTTQWDAGALTKVWVDRARQYESQCRAATGKTTGPALSSWEGKRRCCK